MRKMRKFLNILFLMAFALSFASCEGDDQYDVESIFIGRAWTGDVGMNADNGEPLFSTFTFWGDGFGEEYQYYSFDGALYERFIFSGIGKTIIIEILYWIMVEPEFLIWMM